MLDNSISENSTKNMFSYTPVQKDALLEFTQSEIYGNLTQGTAAKAMLQKPVPVPRSVPARAPAQKEMPRRPVQQNTRTAQRKPVQRPVREAEFQRSSNRASYSTKVHQKKRKKGISRAARVCLTLFLILFISGAAFYGWYYWWTTHATFDYRLQPIVILNGQSVEAADFMSPVEEMERVTAAFRSLSFRPREGMQNVPLTLTLGWRSLDTSTTLHVMTTINQIGHEFREPGPELKAVDFVANLDASAGVPFDVRFVEPPLLLEEYEVGEHILNLTLNDAPFEVLLTVVDTTPPAAEAVAKAIVAGETVIPEDFVKDVFDHSGIFSIEFVNEPNVLSDRDQIVEIEIIDNHGNSAIFAGELYVKLNEEPPVIEGTDTILSMVGDPIMYLPGVTATDDMGRDLTDNIQVDSSGVDHNNEGIYTVVYYVIDATGLRGEVEQTVHVLAIDIDWVNERVDAELARIIKDDMTQLDKVRVIYRWVKNNLNYSPVRGGPATAYEGAYRALRSRSGNCFSYYSISEVMLTRAGIPNMRIDRIPGQPTNHRWNLVNPDDLGWHHFDTTPTRIEVRTDFFTASQARAFTKRYESIGTRNYFTYDPDLYPEIVE